MSAKLRAALATVLVMETIEGAHHAARIALEASEPPVTGLDVERLWEVLEGMGVLDNGTWVSFRRQDAENIAAEYVLRVVAAALAATEPVAPELLDVDWRAAVIAVVDACDTELEGGATDDFERGADAAYNWVLSVIDGNVQAAARLSEGREP